MSNHMKITRSPSPKATTATSNYRSFKTCGDHMSPPSPAFAPVVRLPNVRPMPTSCFHQRMCRPSATYRVPNYTIPDYSSPNRQDHLLEAIKFNDYAKFTHLVDTLPNGANTVFPNKSNQSALLAACFRGRTHMIRYLVEHGADCAYVNDYGWGAVRYCLQWYWNLKMFHEGQQIIQLLLQNGAQDVHDFRGGSQTTTS